MTYVPLYLDQDPDTPYKAIGGKTMRDLAGEEIQILASGQTPCDPSDAGNLSTDLAAATSVSP